MKTDILLRATSERYFRQVQDLKSFLESRLKVKTVFNIHSVSNFEDVFSRYDHVISLSDEIEIPASARSQVSRFRLSRVFDFKGDQTGWVSSSLRPGFISLNETFSPRTCATRTCFIDTDIATGTTRDFILKIFPEADFFAPLALQPHEDLIDIEDLCLDRSWMLANHELCRVSYLHSATFFEKRTSIPSNAYESVRRLMTPALSKYPQIRWPKILGQERKKFI